MADRSLLAELKIPAQRDFIPVAKMVAATLGSQLGFSLEELDELKIAVAQACDSTIEEAEELWGPNGESAVLQLAYGSTERGIAVDVEVLGPRVLPPRAGEVITPPAPRRAPRTPTEAELQRALQWDMVRLFVDDFRHQVDSGRGSIRFRMVKYVIR
jgi:anti-sigma regulatory factor (Ser/Thr protein kinase)